MERQLLIDSQNHWFLGTTVARLREEFSLPFSQRDSSRDSG